MAKDHGTQIKNEDTYEALRDEGYSKEKSARIANAQANSNKHLQRMAEKARSTRTALKMSFTKKQKR
jgi:hypothetical protein